MPELPEVETVRRRLAPHVAGRRIAEATVLDPRLTAPEPPEAVAAALVGDLVVRLDRRGKYLVARLQSGRALVCHLRMTGSFLWLPAGAEPVVSPFLRALLRLDDRSTLAYTDVRRFGTWYLASAQPGADAEAYLEARLGPEPLGAGWTEADLRRRLAHRVAPVKAALVDQRVVAGVGNIYVDEALWRAGVHPRTPAGRLRGERLRRVHAAVREVLLAGIEAQGASIRDYRTPDGGYGSAQERFAVYGRAGEPCPRCGHEIERIVVAQRGTYLCRRCQPPPRGVPRARSLVSRC